MVDGRRKSEMRRTRDCDWTFILFGKSNSGKSALGNLLLGPSSSPHFSTHPRPQPSGHTKKIQSGEAEIETSLIRGEAYSGNNILKFQVIDQPGCNYDDHFIVSNQCLELAKSEMNVVFLIVINLCASYFSQEEFLTTMRMAEFISKQHCMFANAIIIFTHADIVDVNLERDKLEERLQQMFQQEEYGYIQELLELVEKRHLFVNALNFSHGNRISILKDLFRQTKRKLNILIDGNVGFKGGDLRHLLDGGEANILRVSYPNYTTEYRFNPETNLVECDVDGLREGMTNALDKLVYISNGISAILILINLETPFKEEAYDFITNLPHTYTLGDVLNQEFWKYTCLVFKVRMDCERFVRRQIEASPKLMDLDRMVGSRYCWVTDRSSSEECYERIIYMIKELSNANKWKCYTDSAIVGEMRDGILECFGQKFSLDRIVTAEHKRLATSAESTPCRPNCQALLTINNRFFGSESTNISTKFGYFILKNLNKYVAKRFKRQFPDARMKKETFVEFCLGIKDFSNKNISTLVSKTAGPLMK